MTQSAAMNMLMRMRPEKDFAGRQSRGVRPSQEDAYAFSEIVGHGGRPAGLLVVVADGMGGHNAGERASELAVKNCTVRFHDSAQDIANRLDRGLTAANESIAAELERDFALDGMGTTLLAAAVTDAGLEWISVGDSPLYLYRDRKLNRLNEDHSLRPVLRQLAEQGEITAAENERSKNVLRAALTGYDIALIDRSHQPVALRPGDVIIATTDGIHTLTEIAMIEICADAATWDASDLAAKFMDAIRNASHPKQDNTTIAIVKIGSGGTPVS
jgi:serine/threonine protein phosphatase PrpC